MKSFSSVLFLVLAAAVHADITDFSPAFYPTIPVEQTIDINGAVHIDDAGVGTFQWIGSPSTPGACLSLVQRDFRTRMSPRL